jgi:hypothetical protein
MATRSLPSCVIAMGEVVRLVMLTVGGDDQDRVGIWDG